MKRLFDRLGIPPADYRVLKLLPLIYVAWADGKMESVKKERIHFFASREYELSAAGIAVLENRLMGSPQDQFQLKFLQLGRAFRGQGHGRRLFELAKTVARERGAKRLYISATPSEHTIGFYFSMGCVVTAEPDPELFALEPEDIHLECSL